MHTFSAMQPGRVQQRLGSMEQLECRAGTKAGCNPVRASLPQCNLLFLLQKATCQGTARLKHWRSPGRDIKSGILRFVWYRKALRLTGVPRQAAKGPFPCPNLFTQRGASSMEVAGEPLGTGELSHLEGVVLVLAAQHCSYWSTLSMWDLVQQAPSPLCCCVPGCQSNARCLAKGCTTGCCQPQEAGRGPFSSQGATFLGHCLGNWWCSA